MAISGDYTVPVAVNGYSCRNCSDVALAQKHVDPAHPKSGPFDVDAALDPSRATASAARAKKATVSDPVSDVATRPTAYSAFGRVGVNAAPGAMIDMLA